ncbi:hypothetical protein [Urbifossiella limnaea]|uniref:Uncharacterized protein n=1 Tax=Urbifossiella limnaea TaxID=2528023 RepID=A0A517XV15_9BACT|nr:hypothetical protein [Urbifossiella limnaea]QDU21350.1 hypothetical protein ETAA1_33170 [Urbifossiella limnaea]
MNRFFTFAAAAGVVLAGGATAQAQYFHGHVHYHHGHYHLHGHWHYPTPVYPGIGTSGYFAPAARPTVIVAPPAAPVIVPPAAPPVLRPNPLPAPAPAAVGPGLTLRLPAEFPNPVHVRVEQRDYELRPGTEVTVKDRASYLVEFDQGGVFGPFSAEYVEGVYRFAAGARGWRLEPDAPRRNDLPPTPRQ